MDDEIKMVRRIYREDGDYMVRCPHCRDWMILEGDDPDEIRGEQYFHDGCSTEGGWLEVSDTAACQKMPSNY